jgi:hypothetical protein
MRRAIQYHVFAGRATFTHTTHKALKFGQGKSYGIRMAEKEDKYSIYGSTSGIDAGSLRPVDGVHQAEEWAEKMDMKPKMLGLLRSMKLSYPIKSREEFAGMIKKDIPTACEVSGRKLSLKEMISILKDTDFPVKNEIEAASLLASACPVPAQAQA